MSHFDAYCAGFVDAEGSFCISRVKMAKWGFQDNHRLIIDVGQHADRIAVLREFEAAFGGQVSLKRQNRKSYLPGAPFANWHLQRREDVEYFVRSIYPYLRCKRLQAEIALEFLEEAGTSEVNRLSSGLGGRKPLTSAQVEVREQLRLRMRAANCLSKYPPLTTGASEQGVGVPDVLAADLPAAGALPLPLPDIT